MENMRFGLRKQVCYRMAFAAHRTDRLTALSLRRYLAITRP